MQGSLHMPCGFLAVMRNAGEGPCRGCTSGGRDDEHMHGYICGGSGKESEEKHQKVQRERSGRHKGGGTVTEGGTREERGGREGSIGTTGRGRHPETREGKRKSTGEIRNLQRERSGRRDETQQ